ncbi:extracellular solute-binding protein [Neptunomonas phycophila]|uniref:extracellular solute-binding protein n=1 Tax=Neptunomonas phycophila TaxID=1572645 RepID=UPI000948F8F6|nr:extracellular solute-binding protein [Neptunomonas phycophila]
MPSYSLKKLIVVAGLVCYSSFTLAAPSHGIAMHGDLKYSSDFTHFDYTNPDAPKGGSVKQWALGTFDSFNSFIIKGTPADGLGLIYDTLTSQSTDEPFSEYGLIAKTIDVADDNSSVTFVLNKNAKFSDGEPVTANDVAFTFKTLTTEGSPVYRIYYGDVKDVVIVDEHTIRFEFKSTKNAELPLIIGQLPVLPEHYWKNKDFNAPTLDKPVGSGPYMLDSYEAGRSITYKRNPNYWGADIPVNKGRYNFDFITYDYYRDTTVSLEAFKAGEYDFRQETSSKNWATSYVGPMFDNGQIIKAEIPHSRPTGMQAFVFNTRRDIFSNPDVRKALSYAFDFEWTNKNLFYSAYARTNSYFSNSEMAAEQPITPQETALLEPFKDQLPSEVFTDVFKAPVYDGSGNNRRELRTALRLLKSAGWELKNGKLLNKETGQAFTFEILLVQKEFERIVAPMLKNLKQMGIEANIRIVDVSQYINRLRDFDFDMVVSSFGQSSSPGNEQREFWGSYNADMKGSRNIIGIKNPVVDALIEKIIEAPSRQELVYRTRALDRVLQWNYYVIPQFHSTSYRIAYKPFFGMPKTRPLYDIGFDTWWVKEPTK